MDTTEIKEEKNVMDDAAVTASLELNQNFNSWSAKDLAGWWTRHYQKAGHKRLGRVLVLIMKESNKNPIPERPTHPFEGPDAAKPE
jgi:hypothetical protein